jgi:hypothetical protein
MRGRAMGGIGLIAPPTVESDVTGHAPTVVQDLDGLRGQADVYVLSTLQNCTSLDGEKCTSFAGRKVMV